MARAIQQYQYAVFRTLLVLARKKAGLTQTEVARRLNKPQSYVSKYECGKRRLDFAEFIALAEILQIDIAAFVDAYYQTKLEAGLAPLKAS